MGAAVGYLVPATTWLSSPPSPPAEYRRCTACANMLAAAAGAEVSGPAGICPAGICLISDASVCAGGESLPTALQKAPLIRPALSGAPRRAHSQYRERRWFIRDALSHDPESFARRDAVRAQPRLPRSCAAYRGHGMRVPCATVASVATAAPSVTAWALMVGT